MNNTDELTLFTEKADELINAKYIFADTKIAGMLKSIACSETVMALLKSCLDGFDYQACFKRSFVCSEDNALRGEYRAPETTKELIALVFTVLVKIDDKSIELGAFLKNYFYADGSLFGSFTLFAAEFIKPFRNSVRLICEGIKSGKLTSPELKTSVTERRLTDDRAVDTAAAAEVLRLLASDKSAFLSSGLKQETIADATVLIDGLTDALSEGDKSLIRRAFTGYKYFAAAFRKLSLNIAAEETVLERSKIL